MRTSQHLQIHFPLPHFDCLVSQKSPPCIYPASSRFIFYFTVTSFDEMACINIYKKNPLSFLCSSSTLDLLNLSCCCPAKRAFLRADTSPINPPPETIPLSTDVFCMSYFRHPGVKSAPKHSRSALKSFGFHRGDALWYRLRGDGSGLIKPIFRLHF